jgi:hypothetical protein
MGWNSYYKKRGGRWYEYKQRSYREPGRKSPRTETVYVGPVDGGVRRKLADEEYRAVLRENVYKYDRSRPGDRYASEALARTQ